MLITFPLRVMLIDSNRPLPSSSSRPLAPFSTMTTKIMVAAGSVASRRGLATPLIDRPPLYLSIISTIRSILLSPGLYRSTPIDITEFVYTVCIGGGGGEDGGAR